MWCSEVEPLLCRGGEDLRQRRLAGLGDDEPWRRKVEDQLPRHPQRIGEDGAQAFVPSGQVAERRLQGCAVERTGKPHRQRDGVGRAPAFQPLQEPEPALRE